ncbi:MAG: methyltransferase family protein [Candidatus Hodarchaeales archaeon]|jgi:protein-S-isoprenylcysteine O-methyltransferase Ste14
MKKKPQPVKSLFQIAWILLSATILSIIVAFIIRELGVEVVTEIFLFPVDITTPFPLNLFGLLILLLGFLLVIAANFHLLMVGKIGLTDREPYHTPSTLVTSGPYRYTRNPIYFGVVLILFGLAIMTASLTVLISALGVFLFFWRAFVIWEEKKLEETFGEEYLEFKRRVRRWL